MFCFRLLAKTSSHHNVIIPFFWYGAFLNLVAADDALPLLLGDVRSGIRTVDNIENSKILSCHCWEEKENWRTKTTKSDNDDDFRYGNFCFFSSFESSSIYLIMNGRGEVDDVESLLMMNFFVLAMMTSWTDKHATSRGGNRHFISLATRIMRWTNFHGSRITVAAQKRYSVTYGNSKFNFLKTSSTRRRCRAEEKHFVVLVARMKWSSSGQVSEKSGKRRREESQASATHIESNEKTVRKYIFTKANENEPTK